MDVESSRLRLAISVHPFTDSNALDPLKIDEYICDKALFAMQHVPNHVAWTQ